MLFSFLLFVGLYSCKSNKCQYSEESLEKIMRDAGTDKSRDDHKYTDLYSILFDPIRSNLVNITELGVQDGASILGWSRYFKNAYIWGYDPIVASSQVKLQEYKIVPKYFADCPNVYICGLNAYDRNTPSIMSIYPATMDIIIDDALHSPRFNYKALKVWWDYLKPGGYYIIEDLESQNGEFHTLNRQGVPKFIEDIFTNNHIFYVDTLIGHRNFSAFSNKSGSEWTVDPVHHNSHLLVIKKRVIEPYPFYMNINSGRPKFWYEPDSRKFLKEKGYFNSKSGQLRKKRKGKQSSLKR